MKYAKTFGLLAVAASVLMAFVATASATELTSPKNTKLGVGAKIKATSTHFFFDGPVDITCASSALEATITSAGGSTATVVGTVNHLTFSNCNKDTATVISGGALELHKVGSNTGTFTSSGAEITFQMHRSIFGIPITTHCTYVTNKNDVGTITGSDHSGHTTATFHINSDEIKLDPDTSEDACGYEATWTGGYTITSPDHLYVD